MFFPRHLNIQIKSILRNVKKLNVKTARRIIRANLEDSISRENLSARERNKTRNVPARRHRK